MNASTSQPGVLLPNAIWREKSVPGEASVRECVDILMKVVRSDSGISKRLGEFIWAAHCGSGLFDFSLFCSLDEANLNRATIVLNYRLYPAKGGYSLPLSGCDQDFLYELCIENDEFT